MNNIRARRSRRNKKINTTKFGMKRKKKAGKKVKISNELIQKHWDKQRTVKENMKTLGIAFDSNSAVPLPKSKGSEGLESMEVDKMAKKPKTKVVEEFEHMAECGTKTERRIAPGEAQFLMGLIQDHGEDYKAMARDKRNYYQHTPKQLKRKCEAFQRSTQDFSKHIDVEPMAT